MNIILSRKGFDRNAKAVVCGGSEATIKDNIFFENDISIELTWVYFIGTTNPVINNNNFNQHLGYAIKLASNSTANNIDARLNYWHSNNVDGLIYDKHDLPALENEVLYLPKLNRVIVGVGV